MHSAAVKKQNFHSRPSANDNDKSWEVRRRQIAKEVEAACNLPGNYNGPDMEEFAAKYGLNKNSDFA